MDDDANGWTTARRRRGVLRALARDRDGTRSPAWDEARRLFDSEHDLLLAVHQRWQVHLLAQLDDVLEAGGGDLHADVLRAVDELSRVLPGLAAVLRDHVEDPALARAWERLAEYVDLACPCGRRHPLVAGAPHIRSRSRCVVVRRARVIAAGWRRRHSARRRSPGSRPVARAV